jgi:hypothetical protein
MQTIRLCHCLFLRADIYVVADWGKVDPKGDIMNRELMLGRIGFAVIVVASIFSLLGIHSLFKISRK